ncbi:MAG: hypothetical protein DME73_04655 [Verrucomicrobia bacterium]|nr:MAG: hypothetical protein DME73_04655 [Verrucomicrobiota bacterium]
MSQFHAGVNSFVTVIHAKEAQPRISENEALEKGLKEKSDEFVEKGARKSTRRRNPVDASLCLPRRNQ